jgi:malate dehydrogenase (oxaloacetate-decarboxylating)
VSTSRGLLVADTKDLRDFQRPYARPSAEVSDWASGATIGLYDVVAGAQPTILVGTSTAGGAFTEQIV